MLSEEERILQLRGALHQHNYNYYVKNSPIISDQEFDQLMHELIALEEKHPEMADANSPTVRVGSDLNSEFQQVEHAHPMLSLGNTYSRDDVQAFYDRVSEGLGGEPFEVCCELKFDGLSISLIYKDKKLVRAVTRGDGIKGDDVTSNVKTIRSIPLVLDNSCNCPEEFEIRGEILMPWTSFEKLNEERDLNEEPLFANPRNAASGTLKSKNSTVVAKRKLDAYLYYVLGEEIHDGNHLDRLREANSWGFKISTNIHLAKSVQEIFDFIDYWDVHRRELPVATDGIVLKVNNIRQQELLGYTAKSPRWAIAYKFKAERATTILQNVTFQVGRTGAVTPVANMNPVLLAGTIVKRASLHNEDIINQLDLHIGDVVYVEKAGEIIPQIVGVDEKARGINHELGDKVKFITHCPECGCKLLRYEGESAHYCPNSSNCPPQIKGRIEHFISRDAMNIDTLGPETVDSYYELGLIHDAADLYKIKISDIWGDDCSRKRSAQKVIDAIEKSKSIPFERVLYALGIRFVGKVVAQLLAKHFKSMEKIRNASIEDLLLVEGVGNTIATSVNNYFEDPHNLDFVNRLAEAGLNMQLEEQQFLSNILEGQSIVITGTFKFHSRDDYKKLIELHGGKKTSSISKKTSFILAGDAVGPAKMDKANKLGIKVVSEDDFLRMID